MRTTRILFVCLGNICRSPAAEAAFARLVADRGVADRFVLDSAGTGDWHLGHPADARMLRAAERRGIPIDHRARQVTPADLRDFDYVLAMDQKNLADLEAFRSPEARAELRLFRSFDPEAAPEDSNVPDPYYGEADGFDEVLDIVERTNRALLDTLLV